MEPVGELRSADGRWAAVVYIKAGDTFDIRLFSVDENTNAWVEVAGQNASEFATQRAAIAQARARFPQLDEASYRIRVADETVESSVTSSRRMALAALGGTLLVVGLALLYFSQLWPGIAVVFVGCICLGWSIGGFGSAGYGGSNS